MVFGYRMGVPMTLSPDGGSSLPRRAADIASSAPGVVVIANKGVRPGSRSLLQPGDLVFFDASVDDAGQIDHVGIFLGRDAYGHDRFLSSRRIANGPTLGNLGGTSVLDGTGLYAASFRTARRI
jgi:cell wall-associated NlpC family hydrolase